jgi:hypothetical protein
MNMHEEFVLFPCSRSNVKQGYFIGASVLIFDAELVSLKQVVFGGNELDSWGLRLLLMFFGWISYFDWGSLCHRLPCGGTLLVIKFGPTSFSCAVKFFIA